jgi:hypothetical protein
MPAAAARSLRVCFEIDEERTRSHDVKQQQRLPCCHRAPWTVIGGIAGRPEWPLLTSPAPRPSRRERVSPLPGRRRRQETVGYRFVEDSQAETWRAVLLDGDAAHLGPASEVAPDFLHGQERSPADLQTADPDDGQPRLEVLRWGLLLLRDASRRVVRVELETEHRPRRWARRRTVLRERVALGWKDLASLWGVSAQEHHADSGSCRRRADAPDECVDVVRGLGEVVLAKACRQGHREMEHLADPDRVREVDASAVATHVHAGRHLLPCGSVGPTAADSNGKRDGNAPGSAAIVSDLWRRHRGDAGTVAQSGAVN